MCLTPSKCSLNLNFLFGKAEVAARQAQKKNWSHHLTWFGCIFLCVFPPLQDFIYTI